VYAEVAEDAEGAEKSGLGGGGMGLVPSFEPGTKEDETLVGGCSGIDLG